MRRRVITYIISIYLHMIILELLVQITFVNLTIKQVDFRNNRYRIYPTVPENPSPCSPR